MASLVLAAAAFVLWQLLPLEMAPAPATWALASGAVWGAYLMLRSRARPMSLSEQLLAVWGFASCLGLLSYLRSEAGQEFQVEGGMAWGRCRRCGAELRLQRGVTRGTVDSSRWTAAAGSSSWTAAAAAVAVAGSPPNVAAPTPFPPTTHPPERAGLGGRVFLLLPDDAPLRLRRPLERLWLAQGGRALELLPLRGAGGAAAGGAAGAWRLPAWWAGRGGGVVSGCRAFRPLCCLRSRLLSPTAPFS